MTDVKRYAVTGHPVAHSLSPRIHREFGEQTGIALEYGQLDLAADEFEEGVRKFFDDGGAGLNVTAPHKERAFALADHVSMAARVAGAVNTLSQSEEGLLGDTTDGSGLLRDLRFNIGYAVGGTRVLVIGAGGTARSILSPLLGAKPASLTLTNRHFEKASALVPNYSGFGVIETVRLEGLGERRFDLIVNATSASFAGELPDLPEACVEGALCYDVIYGERGTVFCNWALTHGAGAACTGIGMLVEQAAEAFNLWHGVRPETDAVLERLRTDLSLS